MEWITPGALVPFPLIRMTSFPNATPSQTITEEPMNIKTIVPCADRNDRQAGGNDANREVTGFILA